MLTMFTPQSLYAYRFCPTYHPASQSRCAIYLSANYHFIGNVLTRASSTLFPPHSSTSELHRPAETQTRAPPSLSHNQSCFIDLKWSPRASPTRYACTELLKCCYAVAVMLLQMRLSAKYAAQRKDDQDAR